MSNKDFGRGPVENFIPAWLSLLKVVPGQCLLERELRAALGWPSLQNADLSSSKTREEPWPRLLTSLNRTYLLTLSYTYQRDEEITVFPICSTQEHKGFIGAAQPTRPMQAKWHAYKVTHRPKSKNRQRLQHHWASICKKTHQNEDLNFC